jgi:hypothetical protein
MHDMITENASLGEIQMLPDQSLSGETGEGRIRTEEMASWNWMDSARGSRNVCCVMSNRVPAEAFALLFSYFFEDG